MEEVSYLIDDKDQEVKFKLHAYKNSEILQITHEPLYLRGLVLKQKHNTSPDLNEETSYAAVSEELYVFYRFFMEALIFSAIILKLTKL